WFRAHPQQRLLLIIDPLEELIIECHDERQRADFQRVLAEVVRDHPHQMRVVVVLRADFERQFGESPLTPLWQAARYPVPSMTQAELREVIEQPAAERALVFEPPDLVDTLIDAVVGEPGALPLLAFTLQEMYMRYIHGAKTDRALTPAHDRRIGEVRGALNQSATAVYE